MFRAMLPVVAVLFLVWLTGCGDESGGTVSAPTASTQGTDKAATTRSLSDPSSDVSDTQAAGATRAGASVDTPEVQPSGSSSANLRAVVLDPQELTLEAGQSSQFVATAVDEKGREIQGLEFTWEATAGGVISSDGTFIATTRSGEYVKAVRAIVTQGERRAEAKATIVVRPGPVESVKITTPSVELDIGQTHRFQAIAQDEYGNEVTDPDFKWTSSGDVGTITGDGSLTAGTRAATFEDAVTVTVSEGGPTRRDGATVTVRPGPLYQLSLRPNLLQLEPRRTEQLDVIATDAHENRIADIAVSWNSKSDAGQVGIDGSFVAGTVAGTYRDAITVSAQNRGVSKQTAASVLIVPGPISLVGMTPGKMSLYTGDSVSVQIAAFDDYGNRVTPTHTRWASEAGTISGEPSSATFRAGREPGVVGLTAEVSDDSRSVVGHTDIRVDQGYCRTRKVRAQWEASWAALNDDASIGQSLGKSTLGGAFDLDWEFGPVFGERDQQVIMFAKTNIVVRRQGPVAFTIGGDDGYSLSLEGKELLADWSKHSYNEKSVLKILEPGVYMLELSYFEWSGQARLRFDTDPDVLEWDVVEECLGGYSLPPPVRYSLLEQSGQSRLAADRFGVPDNRIIKSADLSGPVLLIPGKDANHRKVVVIQGIDSEAACDDLVSGQQEIQLHQRAMFIYMATQSVAWRDTGDVSSLDFDDIVPFSYGDTYSNCSGAGTNYTASRMPSVGGYYPIYEKMDSCIGVAVGSKHLGSLLERMIELDLQVEFDLVGHSMGGMVASYLVATAEPSATSRYIRSVITLDSPLNGTEIPSPVSVCEGDSSAWKDIRGQTPVVGAIESISERAVLDRFLHINSSPVGGALSGVTTLNVDCSSGSTVGLGLLGTVTMEVLFPGYGLIRTLIGGGTGQLAVGHTCVWLDRTSLIAMAEFIQRPP